MERLLLTQRARVEGFLAFDHFDVFKQPVEDLTEFVRSCDITVREHILDDLDSAPGSINMLYTGANFGKLIFEL